MFISLLTIECADIKEYVSENIEIFEIPTDSPKSIRHDSVRILLKQKRMYVAVT